MKLFRWLFYLVAFAAIAWFATTVPLGNRTLWGHLVAIWATPEAQDLKKGTEDEAKRVATRWKEDLERGRGDGGTSRAPERLDERDRRELDRVVRSRQHAATTP